MNEQEKSELAMQMFGTRMIDEISTAERLEFFRITNKPATDDTCRTCKFWRFDFKYREKWGVCTNQDVDTRSDTNDYGDIPHEQSYGCRFHVAKESGE